MALDPKLFGTGTETPVAIDGDRRIDAEIVKMVQNNSTTFELFLLSHGFPFSPTRTFSFTTQADADAAKEPEAARFLADLIRQVDR